MKKLLRIAIMGPLMLLASPVWIFLSWIHDGDATILEEAKDFFQQNWKTIRDGGL